MGTALLRLAGFHAKSVYFQKPEIEALEAFVRDHPDALPPELADRRRRLTYSTYIRMVMVQELKAKKYLPKSYRMKSEAEQKSKPGSRAR